VSFRCTTLTGGQLILIIGVDQVIDTVAMTNSDTLLEPLRKHVESTILEFEYPNYVVDVRADNHVVQVETFGEPIRELSSGESVDGEIIEDRTGGSRYEVIEDIDPLAGIVDHLHQQGFVTGAYKRATATLDVNGWPCELEKLQPGDFIHFFKWKIPVEIADTYPADEPVENNEFESLPRSGATAIILGERGATYALHRESPDGPVGFYKQTNGQPNSVKKANDGVVFQFVNNPSTGLRDFPETSSGNGYGVRDPQTEH